MVTEAGTILLSNVRRRRIILAGLLSVLAALLWLTRLRSPIRADAPAGLHASEVMRTDPSSGREHRYADFGTKSNASWPTELDRDVFAWGEGAFIPAATPPSAPEARLDEVTHTTADTAEHRQPQLRLQGVLIGPQPQAIIDGRRLGIGDRIHEFRVISIQPRAVVLERDSNHRITLAL